MGSKLIKLRDPYCQRCSLSLSCRTICLMGEGNENAEVVFVGEAPGESEDYIGKPFMGDAGTLLNNLFEEFGIQRKNVYITNAVKCRPKNNAKPKAGEVRACRPYLFKEIAEINPKIIVALGAVAISSLMDTNDIKIGTGRGKLHYSPFNSIKHIPILLTYHPAGVLRNQDWITPVISDFEKLIQFLKGGLPKKKKTYYYSGLAEPIDHLVFDLETQGLDPFKKDKDIICVGTSIRNREGYCTSHPPDMDTFEKYLLDPKIVKIGHNVKFDLKWLITRGHNYRGPIRDTMIEAHLLDENHPSFGLKELAAQYTDMGDYSAKLVQAIKLVKGDMSKVPRNIVEHYCAEDVDATHRLDSLFLPKIEAEGMRPLFDLTMEGMKVFTDAEVKGVMIDEEHRKFLSDKYKKRIAKIKAKLCEATGIIDFNPNSGTQLGRILTGKLGLPIVKQTKTGKVSVDKYVLEKLLPIDKSGIVKAIVVLRKLTGDYSKYLDEEKTFISSDGACHCEFRINGTDTGRYSCVNPNLQQVTKDSPIKEIFVSRFFPGRIIQIDYDQGELRLLAQYSQDPTLIEAFKSGRDIHISTASKFLGIPFDKVTKEQRFMAKTINFGLLYGMGPDKLSGLIHVSIPKAAGLIRDYYSTLDKVRQWKRDREREILEVGEVVSLFGRRRRIPIVDESNQKLLYKAQRQAVNSPIQGGLHDLNILFAVALNRSLRKAGARSIIILAVHDSIILDCPEEEVEDVERLAKKLASNPDTSAFGFEFSIPLTVSVGHGVNWKEASESD